MFKGPLAPGWGPARGAGAGRGCGRWCRGGRAGWGGSPAGPGWGRGGRGAPESGGSPSGAAGAGGAAVFGWWVIVMWFVRLELGLSSPVPYLEEASGSGCECGGFTSFPDWICSGSFSLRHQTWGGHPGIRLPHPRALTPRHQNAKSLGSSMSSAFTHLLPSSKSFLSPKMLFQQNPPHWGIRTAVDSP